VGVLLRFDSRMNGIFQASAVWRVSPPAPCVNRNTILRCGLPPPLLPSTIKKKERMCMSDMPSLQEALIYLMVVISAADREMTDAELGSIGSVIRSLPVFEDFDENRIIEVARQCQKLLQERNGPESVLDLVRDAVPPAMRDTAYALAAEVVAADRQVEPEEKRMLQIVRSRLQLEPLVAAALERAAKARHRRFS